MSDFFNLFETRANYFQKPDPYSYGCTYQLKAERNIFFDRNYWEDISISALYNPKYSFECIPDFKKLREDHYNGFLSRVETEAIDHIIEHAEETKIDLLVANPNKEKYSLFRSLLYRIRLYNHDFVVFSSDDYYKIYAEHFIHHTLDFSGMNNLYKNTSKIIFNSDNIKYLMGPPTFKGLLSGNSKMLSGISNIEYMNKPYNMATVVSFKYDLKLLGTPDFMYYRFMDTAEYVNEFLDIKV